MNTLQTLANGDTNYIAKHNGNYTNIKAAIDALEANLASQVQAAQGPGGAYYALFGLTSSVVGVESYLCHGSSTTLTVDAGFNWKPSIPTVVRQLTAATISFSGLSAGTYYIYADNTGAPVRSATAGGEDLYSVVWTGSAFGAITRIANVVWGAADNIAAQVSTALGATYTRLDDRLEAGEVKAVAGALARDWNIGRLSKSVAGAVDVTLSATEANNAILNFTGALTGDINVIVPLGASARGWTVTNATTGAYTLTVKGSTGAGVEVATDGTALLGQDGTDVFQVVTPGGIGAGTVTSVAISAPAFLSVGGSPITGSGTLALTYSGTALPIANGGTGGTSASAARTALGVAIGSDVQAYDPDLAALAGLTSAADKGIQFTGAGTAGTFDLTTAGKALLDDADAAAQRTTLGLGTAATLASDTDVTLAANSDTRLATQKAVKAYVDSQITGGASDVMVFKGVIDCSANPNYPAADAGNLYKISVAGKIGGASGPNVEAGDTIYCIADSTASGNHATVGAYWTITQVNIDGAVTGPASAVGDHVAIFDSTSGKIIKDSGLTLAGANTGDETAASIATIDHAATAKGTPVDADEMNLLDSAASWALKKFTFTNLKAFLKTYFDTLYGSGSGSVTTVSVTTANGVSGSVDTATTTPAITLTLGAITPTTVVASGAISGSNLSNTNTGDETTTTTGALINGATGKTTPVDADYIGLMDSAASNVLKKLSWANIKATLKTYFDTLYAAFGEVVNAQTGTTYTYLNGDSGKLVTHSNGSAIAGTLPQAGSGGNFAANWWMDVQNRGAGTLTITPTTSTIDGAATLAFTTGQGARIVSDGTNYFTQRGGAGIAAGGGSSTSITGTSGAAGGDATATGGTSTTSANAGGKVIITGGTPGATGIGGAVTITGGPGGTTGGSAAAVGGAISLTGGTAGGTGAAGASAGGAVAILGGTGSNTNTAGAGGVVTITGGAAAAGTSSGQVGGAVTITGGTSTQTATGGAVNLNGAVGGTDSTGGAINLTAGNGTGNGFGGAINLTAGTSGSGFTGGAINITAGTGGVAFGGAGGVLTLKGGPGSGAAAGGIAKLQGGDAGATGNGGAATVIGGTASAGAGGAVNITGAAGVGTNQNGGNVNLTPGAATGSGNPGNVVLNNSGAALATTAIGGFTCFPTCAGTPTGTPASIPTGTVPMVFDSTNFKLYAYVSGAWKATAAFT